MSRSEHLRVEQVQEALKKLEEIDSLYDEAVKILGEERKGSKRLNARDAKSIYNKIVNASIRVINLISEYNFLVGNNVYGNDKIWINEDKISNKDRVLNLIASVRKNCTRMGDGNKNRRAFVLDINSGSEVWEEWEEMFPGAEYDKKIPAFVTERFKERSDIPYDVDITLKKYKLYITIREVIGKRKLHVK